jgi:V8-like Glu-specific endopeptidase
LKDNYKPLDKYGERLVLNQYGISRKGRIIYAQPDIFTMAYALSTLSGQSGTPVCTGNKILAIHCGGGKSNEDFNVGRLITHDLLANL